MNKGQVLAVDDLERFRVEGIVGSHSRMLEVFDTLHKVSGSDATVLITGETGTGKELIARAIHRHSPRRDRPFVAISCPAIPETLIESELFGHVRGSFTGAVSDKKGLFEEANHGTLLLDEIAETPPAIQVKLLRALQEREIRRVGATTPVKVDVRILAATNRDPKQLVESGAFREDLYYRLNVVSINLPPLRERSTDIPQLAEYFVARACKEAGRSPMAITIEARRLLLGYHWPGNVRQLETVLQRAVLLAHGRVIDYMDLPIEVRFSSLPPREAAEAASPARAEGAYRYMLPAEGIDLEQVKWGFVQQALQASGGAITEAAKLLGMTYRVLHYRLGRSSRSAGGQRASEGMRARAAQADTGRACTG
jgi:transcriptional regulator with GAF, ATPase, and Fis domain